MSGRLVPPNYVVLVYTPTMTELPEIGQLDPFFYWHRKAVGGRLHTLLKSASGALPPSVANGDFKRDGKPDLAVTTLASDNRQPYPVA